MREGQWHRRAPTKVMVPVQSHSAKRGFLAVGWQSEIGGRFGKGVVTVKKYSGEARCSCLTC